jgi:hypothetical protein
MLSKLLLVTLCNTVVLNLAYAEQKAPNSTVSAPSANTSNIVKSPSDSAPMAKPTQVALEEYEDDDLSLTDLWNNARKAFHITKQQYSYRFRSEKSVGYIVTFLREFVNQASTMFMASFTDEFTESSHWYRDYFTKRFSYFTGASLARELNNKQIPGIAYNNGVFTMNLGPQPAQNPAASDQENANNAAEGGQQVINNEYTVIEKARHILAARTKTILPFQRRAIFKKDWTWWPLQLPFEYNPAAAPWPTLAGFCIAYVAPWIFSASEGYISRAFQQIAQDHNLVPNQKEQILNMYYEHAMTQQIDNTPSKVTLRTIAGSLCSTIVTVALAGSEGLTFSILAGRGNKPVEHAIYRFVNNSSYLRVMRLDGLLQHLVLGVWGQYDYTKWRDDWKLLIIKPFLLSFGAVASGLLGAFCGDWFATTLNLEPGQEVQMTSDAIKRAQFNAKVGPIYDKFEKGQVSDAVKDCKKEGLNPAFLITLMKITLTNSLKTKSEDNELEG